MAASLAVHAKEPMRRDAALEEAAELSLDEAWNAAPLFRAGEERGEMEAHRAVKNGRLHPPW